MTYESNHPDFPIDWHDLFVRIDNEQIIVEFARSFAKNGEKIMSSLQQAVAGGDPEEMELYAHALKGSASNIGAVWLAKTCWQLEKTAAEKQVEKAVELFKKITSEYTALKALLEKPDWVQKAKDASSVKFW